MIEEIRFNTVRENRSGFVFYNDDVARDIAFSVTDLVRPGDVIVSYHYKGEVLIHVGHYYGKKGACSAGQQLLKTIETEDIHCRKNDERIRKKLGEPEFSTKAVLATFIKDELKKLK